MTSERKSHLATIVVGGAMLVVGIAIGYSLQMFGGGHAMGGADGMHDHSAESTPAQKTLYTCGMHPEIISDEPGYCPKCEMRLTPMDSDRAAMILEMRGESTAGVASSTSGGPTIRIDPVTEQNIGVRYAVAEQGPMHARVRTVGMVDYAENSISTVTTKIGGWAEQIYVNQAGVPVDTGDPLFELYSPELFSAQQEYLTAVRDVEQAKQANLSRALQLAEARLNAARERLGYFDISASQLDELNTSGQARKTLTITAPTAGIVTKKNLVQGDSVEPGTAAYEIADLSTVWVLARVYESALSGVHVGQKAEMTLDYMPGKKYTGEIKYIYPYITPGTREVSVRVEFDNENYELKPGMYATVYIDNQVAENAVTVPREAVINTGEREIVFVSNEPGKFQLREVTTGSSGGGDDIQILEGVAAGERVVVSGQFLLDSESRLREATMKMLHHGSASPSEPTPANVAETQPSAPATQPADGSPVLYTCPMEEHAYVVSDQPGRCPDCEMRLKPTSEVPHGKKSEAIWKHQHAQ